jgi:nicotinamidase-related amidase
MATPARSALVVIDAQQEYFAPLGKVVLPRDRPRCRRSPRARVGARRRRAGRAHRPRESSARSQDLRARQPDAGDPSRGAARRREPVMTKHLPGSFTGTALEAFLRERGIERLLVSGFMTQMCVDTTGAAGGHLGFAVTVLSDACAAMAVKGPDGAVIAADQVHRTHLGSLQGFLADIKPVQRALGGAPWDIRR